MKLVIDIPEQMYINAKEDMLSGSDTLVNAIKNGKPLPKGHWMAVEALRAQNEEKEATWMIEPNETGFYKCSACGFGALVSFKHCPGCGKRMKKFWEE